MGGYRYLTDKGITAFHVAGTLRQFDDVWGIGTSNEGSALLNVLRAHLIQLPGGKVTMTAGEVLQAASAPDPGKARLEAILGNDTPVTWFWMQRAMESATAVASINWRLRGRHGTGFLVRAGDLGFSDAHGVTPEEPVVLTNFHVVNRQGVCTNGQRALVPDEAEVKFEAAEGGAGQSYDIARIIWESPVAELDAAVLRLAALPENIAPLQVALRLPLLPDGDDAARPHVNIIGHPGGRDLSFSFLDNEVLDHEGPDKGTPPNEACCRVHYRTPTEGGSSGSPVFNNTDWRVIALHHAGGEGMAMLNGKEGFYAANEGIWIQSIIQAAKE